MSFTCSLTGGLKLFLLIFVKYSALAKMGILNKYMSQELCTIKMVVAQFCQVHRTISIVSVIQHCIRRAQVALLLNTLYYIEE